MGKVILGFVISLDGYIEDKNGSASRLYANYADLGSLRDLEAIQAAMRTTGAVIMGRRAYERGNGDYTGYEFQTPIFVVTHNPPETPAKGENENLKFHFVADGVESAVRHAKAAAGDKNVTIVGGAEIAQQVLKAGLVDEVQIDIAPVLLGAGLRAFDNLSGKPIELESTHVGTTAGVTNLVFRVLN